MFIDLLPVIAILFVALLIPTAMLRATRRRENYCGRNPKNCFWCGEKECELYRLENLGT